MEKPTLVARENLTEALEPPSKLKHEYLLKTLQAPMWRKDACNELGRLAQGFETIQGNNIIFFIYKYQVQKNKKLAYGRIVCLILPHKEKRNRARLTAGSNLVTCDGVTSTPTAGIQTMKTHYNLVMCTEKAQHVTISVKYFYLTVQLRDYEHLKLIEVVIPQKIMDACNLHDKVVDGHTRFEIRGGMP